MASSETWDNHRKLTLDDQLYSQLIPKLKYTFIIHKSVDKCPMLVDIYFACLQNTPKGSRKSNCKYHHDILQDCLMTELKLDVERFAHHECLKPYKKYLHKMNKIQSNLPPQQASIPPLLNDLEPFAQCLRTEIIKREPL